MTVKLTPYITLEGTAKEAIQFYEQTIGAKVLSIITYGEMPEMPNTFNDELKNLIAHAKLQVGETELMFFCSRRSAYSRRKTGYHMHYNKRCGKIKTNL